MLFGHAYYLNSIIFVMIFTVRRDGKSKNEYIYYSMSSSFLCSFLHYSTLHGSIQIGSIKITHKNWKEHINTSDIAYISTSVPANELAWGLYTIILFFWRYRTFFGNVHKIIVIS